jgi:tetratricopeptide (TPR) repeat protein
MSLAMSRFRLFSLIAIFLLAMPAQVWAQATKCGEKREVTSRALDELTWKQLNSAYELVGEEEYDEAYERLQVLMGRATRDKYLQAVLSQALAQTEWSRKNYDAALMYFEQAVELDTLPDQTHFALMYQISQLYFMKDRFQEALDALELWFCKVPEKDITSHAYVLKASIYARMDDYANVLPAIDKAIEMDEDPQESWYQLKLASHYELEQFPQAAQTLEVLISKWPNKKVYWTQLSQIYYKLKQEDKALATMALAYRSNLLDNQGDLLYLASLYSGADIPYKSAQVMEKGIRDGLIEPTQSHWTMVAESWYAAEELQKSLVAFREAGQASSDGELDLRRGFLLVDMEDWGAALEALNAALQKGGLNETRMGEAYLLRGMTQFNLGNFDAASADWGRASRYEKTRNAAQQWMNHLAEERRRRA